MQNIFEYLFGNREGPAFTRHHITQYLFNTKERMDWEYKKAKENRNRLSGRNTKMNI